MLGSHIRFLAQVNLSAAKTLRVRIVSEIRSLETMSEQFPFLNEEFLPYNKYHKLFVENWFLILYQIQDDTVFVDYVLDYHQDFPWLLNTL